MTFLSVLDQSPIRAGGTSAQALRETVELAQHVDALGYHRYWLSEHHSSSGLASATPEILIAEVASKTQRIRVGSGGVMMTHYSPLKVAEQFRMLEALYPGRIDLGVGRAPGSDTRTARALAHGPGQLPLDAYPDQLLDLYGYLSDSLPHGHPFYGIKAMPEVETMPELWVLGSSLASAQYAAELGWAFCFAHFISQDGSERAIQLYRDRFQPSPFLAGPRAALGVSATVAQTDEEAEYLSWSRWCWRIAANHGERRGIPPPDDAIAFPYTEPERDYIEYMKSRSLHGSPERVRRGLEAVGAAHGVDEYVVVTITYDFAARKRSYALLAEAFGLSGVMA